MSLGFNLCKIIAHSQYFNAAAVINSDDRDITTTTHNRI
jgi:hypothetical protein